MTRKHSTYKKIYEETYGPVPKDEFGRSYDIHHLDGNHSNNDPSNLKAVTIQEHYDIHLSQGDHFACWMIAHRLKLSQGEIVELARLAGKKGDKKQKERAARGGHVLCRRPDGSSLQQDRVKAGTHNLLGAKHDGKHNPRYKTEIHTFKNTVTGEVDSLTQHDFVVKYCLQNNRGNINGLLKGKKSMVKNWIVINKQ
jgi:hypothetical protein